ncbi:hypothetical protein HK103_005366 [Boothiomyces macroporosus]|uniref:Peptidase A1 domain-containing protein n=1 Tax=Boothiomyces macroporosus TaxID=261099 RepID=A0AAD5ULL5_9FUNG|nr:hypothetical protein HK103_005366 [Boothiomyces macroporosus]
MVSFTTLCLTLATVYAAPAKGPITLPLTRTRAVGPTRYVASTKFALERFGSSKKRGSAPLQDEADVFYQATATVGTGQSFTVDLDTGSSDVWIRGSNCQSNTSGDTSCSGNSVDTSDSNLQDQGQSASVQYGSGSVDFEIYTGDITVAGATASQLPFGVTTQETGFSGASDGLLGLGFDSISQISSTLGQSANFFDALGFSGSNNVFAFYLSNSADGDSGEVTLGGVDSSKYTGAINYVALNSETYWQFDASSVTYSVGKATGKVGTTSSGSTDAISDTGTTLIILGTSAANAINKAIGASAYSSSTGAYAINCNIAKTGPAINFKFGSKFTLSVPASIYVLSNGDGTCISGITQGASSQSPNIFGDILTRAYYTVYDKNNNRVGFAKAVHP